MKYIGLDLASCSGWVLLNNDVILERGTIQLIHQMDLPQKLHYFHLELRNLLVRLKPEWIFIEDVILGISGAKTLAYLARLNGVAIATSFEFLQERVKLYSPTHWKSHSFEGLSGMAKKWQIQLATIKHYRLPITGNFDSIDEICENHQNNINGIKCTLEAKKEIKSNQLSLINRKRNPLTDDLKATSLNIIKETEKMIKELNVRLKSEQLLFDKKMTKISIDITAQTGMSDNVCDACGVALCGYKETLNESP